MDDLLFVAHSSRSKVVDPDGSGENSSRKFKPDDVGYEKLSMFVLPLKEQTTPLFSIYGPQLLFKDKNSNFIIIIYVRIFLFVVVHTIS